MDVTPLPEDTPFASCAAYNRCRTLEAAVDVHAVDGYPPPVVCARLLGHLLRLAPIGAQAKLQQEITDCHNNAELMELAALYLNCFIRAFKRNSRETATPADHPYEPSPLNDCDYAPAVDEGKLDGHTAQEWAMLRDNHCCMLTSLMDYRQPRDRPGRRLVVYTAHIIPATDTTTDQKRSQSANVESILKMFSRDDIIDGLAGGRIHCLENNLSLNSLACELFDDLWLWFKPMKDAPHQYYVCTAGDRTKYIPPVPEFVTFATDTKLPLPDPNYLALHAFCCEVAWISGVVEYFSDIESKMDDDDDSSDDLSIAA